MPVLCDRLHPHAAMCFQRKSDELTETKLLGWHIAAISQSINKEYEVRRSTLIRLRYGVSSIFKMKLSISFIIKPDFEFI